MVAGRQRSRGSSTRRSREVDDQAGNTFRYLYWRLSEKQFQQLCAALLRRKFDPVQCFPVGMADEGIDAISHRSIVYQVKWTSKFQQNPASWLRETLDGEKAKIRKLVEAGRATRYILLTSVAGTTTATGTGSIQKLQKALDDYAAELGIPVECWWQQDIDAEVDGAGDSIKWSYPDMLAGTDAIRYLIFGSGGEGNAARMRETMNLVLAHQARADSQVRFSQVEIEGASLDDLFVDVHASLVAPPRKAALEFQRNPQQYGGATRGAVDALLDTTLPLTFLLGVPGQGKSTLTQYLCQVHRSVILASDEDVDVAPSAAKIREPKLPVRVELKDYAAWVDGFDTFDDERPRISRRRSKTNRSAERYIAELCVALSGGRAVDVEDVQSLLKYYPSLLVFDGLDEVADPDLRGIVVDEIEALAARMGKGESRLRKFQLLVTARPNATHLPEPTPDTFQRMRLEPMNPALQNEFVIKWCDARGIDGTQRQDLRRIFRDRTTLDHVSKLADNPMQLSILLHLISKKGDAVPVARTPLYTDYMSTLMDREVAAGNINRNAAPQVQEVTAFLGWHMQSGVETNPTAGAMHRRDIETTLILYLREVGADHEDAAALFQAASDRFWALTSETDELFEFAVQPVREYFAARFLADWAGRDMREPLSKQRVLSEMLGRPYWLNTARFYAGFASPNELAALRYGIEDAVTQRDNTFEHRIAAWALLADGVFIGNTRVQRDVVDLLTDDLTVMLARNPQYVSDFQPLAANAGGTQLSHALQQQVSHAPDHSLAPARVEMMRRQASLSARDFESWWVGRLPAATDEGHEAAWLRLGASFGVRQLAPELTERLNSADLAVCVAALGVGATTQPHSPLADGMLRAVLDGDASDAPARGNNEASALLVAMRPQWFHQAVPAKATPASLANGHLAVTEVDASTRNGVWARLEEKHPKYAALRAAARRRQHSQGGTTEPWQAPARELARLHGPCWLAAEIAVTGAAAFDLVGSGSKDRGGAPLGPDADYGTLVVEVRKRPDAQWWRNLHDEWADTLSRRTWTLALIAAGTPAAVASNLTLIDEVLTALTPEEFSATAASSSRISQNGSARRLPQTPAHPHVSLRTQLLLAHFRTARFGMEDITSVSDHQLADFARPEPAYWPIAEALAERVITSPSAILLEGLERLGIDSLSGISGMAIRLGDVNDASAIMASPGRYPTEWVLLAQEALETPAQPVFEEIARRGAWVPKVPRL